jgi:hypothetical protein
VSVAAVTTSECSHTSSTRDVAEGEPHVERLT